ncbi:MAG TPA: outer membrane beta-barrel protein [Gallionellaceae bacterium]
MKKIIMGVAAVVSLIFAAQVEARGFDGFYVGAKAGYNDSSTSGSLVSKVGRPFLGVEAGYNWIMNDRILLGANVWGDDHKQTVTGRDYGVDLKVGGLKDNMLYYAKLGVAQTHPGSRPHYGLGAENVFDRHWGAVIEYAYDSTPKGGITYTNNKFMVGVNYHF